MTDYLQDAHEQDANRDVSLLAHDQYMRELRWIPFYDREQQAVWVEQIKQGLFARGQPVPNTWRLQEAQHARTFLVESYQAVITSLATSFARCCATYEIGDFVNEGTIGLLIFLDRLDAYEDLTGAAFHALAFTYIRAEMLEALRNRTGIVRIPHRVLKQLKQLEQVEQECLQVSEREPTHQELAQGMHVPVEKVFELLDYRRRRQVESLEGLLEEGNAEECLDFVSVFEVQQEADEVRDIRLREAIQTAIATTLTERQQEVVRLRYGFGEGPCHLRSHGAIAQMLGVGEPAVHKVDYRAKERLGMVLASAAIHAVGLGVASPVDELSA